MIAWGFGEREGRVRTGGVESGGEAVVARGSRACGGQIEDWLRGRAVSAYGRVVGGREGLVLGRRGEEQATAAAGSVGRAMGGGGARVVLEASAEVKLAWAVPLDGDLRRSWSRWLWCW